MEVHPSRGHMEKVPICDRVFGLHAAARACKNKTTQNNCNSFIEFDAFFLESFFLHSASLKLIQV